MKRSVIALLLACWAAPVLAQLGPGGPSLGPSGGGSGGGVPAGSIAIGGTAVTGGTTGRILFDNGGFVGELAVTGSGNAVLQTSPSISGLTVTGSFTATGLVTNADLTNAATTVNGQTCTLGSSCTVTAAASAITVGTTIVGGGTTTRVLYDNAGVLGEYTATQLTALINPATAALSGALPAWPNNATTFFRGDGTYATLNCAAMTDDGTACSQNTGTSGATIPLLNGTNTWSGTQTFGSGVLAATNPALAGTVTGNNTIPLGILAQSSANTMLGNWTGSTANVAANAMPSCADTGGNHLNYVSGTGITCGTSGAAAAAGTLTGTTLASNVVTSSLTSVGTLAGLTVSTSFTATGLVANASLANMANSTVKCRTTAGTGVPEDCTAAQAAAIVGSVGGALKSKIITITRDLTVASGGVAYTGVGFQPSSCFATGAVAGSLTQYVTVFSMVDSARTSAAVGIGASVTITNTNFLLFVDVTGSNTQGAVVASYDADGFTLTWTKNGTPSGTATIYVMCYR